MHLSATFVALAAVLASSALPVRRTASPTDILVLQFADVLEQFETQFYTQALAKFQESDFIAAGFVDAQVPIQQFTAIQCDEATHDKVLQSTIVSLGAVPVTSCQFDFGSALNDVPTMAATARVVENLGVAAYLGAAHLISDPVLLTAAGSILTVEARHQTVLNILNGGSAIPQAFDIAFSPSEVLAVASQFISGCDLGVPANPTLSVTNNGTVAPGTQLTFSSAALNGTIDPSTLSCQMMVGGASFAIVLPFQQCVVPSGIDGPVAIYVTSDAQPLANNIRDQATNSLVAGPTMAFIDTVPQDLASLAITGSAPSGSGSNSSSVAVPPPSATDAPTASVSASAIDVPPTDTSVATAASAASATDIAATATDSAVVGSSTSVTTISPDAASSIISSAQATDTPAAVDNAAGAGVAPPIASFAWSMATSLPSA
jgi:hypothetical protein